MTWTTQYSITDSTSRTSTAFTENGSLSHNTAAFSSELNEQGDLAVTYSGGARLESRQGHRLPVPQSLTAHSLYSLRL
jgi:hypothetical protein